MSLNGEAARLEQQGQQPLEPELLILAGIITGLSEGRVRVAVNEEDDTTQTQVEAAHFLKLDETRLGRDLEVYGFIGRVAGNELALGDFVGEVIIPLRTSIPAVYDSVAPLAEQLGYEFLDAKYHQTWGAIFVSADTQ